MPIERKLAAIMFTDIAGYTAQMSKNEDKALALLDKDYIATSWLDWVTDAIIFIIYPIGILIVIIVSIFTDISYWNFEDHILAGNNLINTCD